jgi:hypothetical protein
MNPERKLLTLLNEIKNEEYNRFTIYLNKDLVDRIFFQRLSPTDKLTIHRAFSGELGGGINALVYELKAKFTHMQGIDSQITIPPLMKAHILEYYMKAQGDLKDPSSEGFDPREDNFKHLSDNSLIKFRYEVTAQSTNLSNNLARLIQEKRIQQENDSEIPHLANEITLVWTSSAGKRKLASIALKENVIPDYRSDYISYNDKPPIGIFGMYESEDMNGDVLFIRPVWIWSQYAGIQ